MKKGNKNVYRKLLLDSWYRPDNYIGSVYHSLWIVGKMYRPLFTVKDIKQGEEITCSYTLYDLEAD